MIKCPILGGEVEWVLVSSFLNENVPDTEQGVQKARGRLTGTRKPGLSVSEMGSPQNSGGAQPLFLWQSLNLAIKRQTGSLLQLITWGVVFMIILIPGLRSKVPTIVEES